MRILDAPSAGPARRGRGIVGQVARRVGLGSESFRKRFTTATGRSPGAWRIHRRIDTACTLLLGEGLTLGAIAADLGYPDVPTFAKQFRRVIGQPPAAWRRTRLDSATQATGRHAILHAGGRSDAAVRSAPA